LRHDDIRIEQLANRIDLLPMVAGWIYDEWWQDVEDASLNTLTDLLRAHRVPDQIPMTLVALLGSQAVGTATLLAHDGHWCPLPADHRAGGLLWSVGMAGARPGGRVCRHVVRLGRRASVRDIISPGGWWPERRR
jgi:hypothetical protein